MDNTFIAFVDYNMVVCLCEAKKSGILEKNAEIAPQWSLSPACGLNFLTCCGNMESSPQSPEQIIAIIFEENQQKEYISIAI